MQNGMVPAQLTPHNRPYPMPTPIILISPSKSGEARRRLARRLVGRAVCRLRGAVRGAGGDSIVDYLLCRTTVLLVC